MLSNTPSPAVVHWAVFAEPPIEPLIVYVEFEQITSSTPAFTNTPGFIVRVTLSDTAEQTPAGSSVVNENTTAPAAISAGVGVYIADISWSLGL